MCSSQLDARFMEEKISTGKYLPKFWLQLSLLLLIKQLFKAFSGQPISNFKHNDKVINGKILHDFICIRYRFPWRSAVKVRGKKEIKSKGANESILLASPVSLRTLNNISGFLFRCSVMEATVFTIQ